jgi:photosystem II stability/assembly factor-like uncharacterized protein
MSVTRTLRLPGVALVVAIAGLSITPQTGHARAAFDTVLLNNLAFRNAGPMHGGRATTGVGVPGNKQLYYMGAAGGGVWKTDDGGQSWHNISDGYFNTGSIGDIAVYTGDPKIIYVGTGEAPVRAQMSSYGDGVYKSTDAGKTWKHIGLDKTMQISRVVVNPSNPNIVYVAAQGNRWVPSEDRGIYKSTDGGATWRKILFSSRIAGASDLEMDPYDPDVLYAAFWDHQMFPWMDRSGGPGSGIWKSTDAGEHWMHLKVGLPQVMGKITLAISPVNSSRIYAAIENEKSGLFRSDDGGRTWKEVNDGGGLATRPFYYMGLAADPKKIDTIYYCGADLLKSTDGGKTFSVVKTLHTDTHSLWINPADPQNMILTDDGGATVSFDDGKTWTSTDNQPTAQLYTARADDLFPYNLYSGQQDGGAEVVPSRILPDTSYRPGWKLLSDMESARPSFDPKNPRVVFTPDYQGELMRVDTDTGISHDVSPWPGQKLGEDAAQMTYRFNFSPPTTWSPFDSRIIYFGANVLFRTSDQGETWQVISPDLTRNEKSKQGRGGLWWYDGAGGEVYNTIYAIAESPVERGTIWVGTDDGLNQLTRDNGKIWTNVTPRKGATGWVYTIEPSPYEAATAYASISRHRTGDMRPYFYKTTDYGKTWINLGATLPQDQPARVLREDPVRKGMLYAATEYRMWISFDDGAHWHSFQQNLPHVPFSDILVHDSDLIVSTEGRGFWILDDLTTLRQISPDVTKTPLTLFKPRDTHRIVPGGGMGEDKSPALPVNPPNGVIIRYYLADAVPVGQTLKLDIVDASGDVVRSYTSATSAPVVGSASQSQGQRGRGDKGVHALLTTTRGLNQAVWDFRAAPIAGATTEGPMMPEGHYTARMTLGSTTTAQPFNVISDPRTASTVETETERMKLARHIMVVISATKSVNNELRDVLRQARDLEKKQTKHEPSRARSRALGSFIAHLERIEQRFQPSQGPGGPGSQMVLTTGLGPVDQFGLVLHAVDGGEGPLDQGDKLRAKEVEALCVQVRTEAEAAMNADVPKINALLESSGVSQSIVRHPGVAPPPGGGARRKPKNTGKGSEYY